MFILGAQLAVVPSARPGTKSITYVLWIRYIIMPAVSLGFVSATAGKGWYHDDPLMWYGFQVLFFAIEGSRLFVDWLVRFLLILIPCGPSAMLLISLAEMLNVDQGPIAGFLTISVCLFHISPIIGSF
jgi:predicted permease